MLSSNRLHTVYFGIFTSVTWFALFAFTPYLTPYVESLGADNVRIGLMVGAFGFAQIILKMPMGMLSDRLQNRKALIIMCSAVGLAAVTGLWLSDNIWMIIIMRVLLGITASCWLFFCMVFNSYYLPAESVKAQGILSAYGYIGQVVSYIVAAFVMRSHGIQSVFLICAVFFAISFIMSFFIREIKTAPIPRYSLTEAFKVGKDPWVNKIAMIGFLAHMIIFGAMLGFTPQIATKIGANELELAVLSILFALTSIPASFLCAAPIVKKVGDRNILTYSTLVFAIACLMQPYCTSMPLLFITQGLAGLARGFSLPVLVGLLIKNTPYEKQAAAMAYFQMIHGIGIMMGPIVTGAISQAVSLTAAYWVLSFMGMAMPLISHFGLREQKPCNAA
ncbi:MAG: MFS transporter [Christensenellales bacterium]